MGLFDFLRKNPLKMSVKDLKERELKLRIRSDEVAKETSEIGSEIELLFQKSKEAKSRLEEITIANRIKTLAQKKEMKGNEHAELERELRALSNLIIIKEHEEDLKKAGLWKGLQSLPAEQLENRLIKMKLEKENREMQRRTIIEMISSILKPAEGYEEGLEDVLKVMKEVKEGKLEPKEASKAITEKEIE